MKVTTTLNHTWGVIGLLALCSCADPPRKPVASAPPAPTEQTASSGPIALTTPPGNTAKTVPAKKRDATAKSAAPASTAPNTATAPVQLVGMNEGEVQALLGSPSLVEDNAPGKTWRFRKHDCVLSVALYPDVQTRVFRTLSYEVTSDDHNAGAKQLCETKFGNVAVAD